LGGQLMLLRGRNSISANNERAMPISSPRNSAKPRKRP